MKVSGTGPSAPVSSGDGRRRPEGGFAAARAGQGGEASATERAGGSGAVASLGALLALQEAGGPLERRRRALRRADAVLEGLESVRLALLDGEGGSAAFERLGLAGRQSRERTDDDGLEMLLDQVDLRAAVELAKAEARAAA